MTVEEAKEEARKTLSDERYEHTQCVADMAKKLAKRFGENEEKALVAAYLHDIAKEFEKADLLQMIEHSDIIELEILKKCPSVWHGYAGAIYAKETLLVDSEIADAIRYHTTGKARMTLLEKIVFLADCVSEERDYSYLKEARNILFAKEPKDSTLDEAILFILEHQIERLTEEGKQIHPDSTRAYNFLIQKRDSLER